MKYAVSLLIFLLFPVMLFSEPSPGDVTPVTIHPQNTKLAKLYIAMMDRDIEYGLKTMLDSKASHPPFLAEELAGTMAYAYNFSASKFFHQEATLHSVRKVCQTFQTAVTGGESAYRIAQRLEPLIKAYLCLRDSFTADEQEELVSILRDGLNVVEQNSVIQQNHKGMLCSAVLALGNTLTGEQAYLDKAKAIYHTIQPMFAPNGEVLENGVPNLSDSAQSLQSLFLLRLVSKDSTLDSILKEGLLWYCHLFTSYGIPLVYNHTHPSESDPKYTSRVLGMLAYFAPEEPELELCASHFLETLTHQTADYVLPRGGFYFLLGAQYHQEITHDSAKPVSFCQLYRRLGSQYFVVRKNYQTAVSLRSGYPYKGIQVWAYKDDPPLIFPHPLHPSETIGTGFDSSCMDVQASEEDYEYRVISMPGGAYCLIVKQGPLFTGYLFTQDTTVFVVHSGSTQSMDTVFTQNQDMCGKIQLLNNSTILFQLSKAKILPGLITPEKNEYEMFSQIRFPVSDSAGWTTFCGPDTRSLIRHVLDSVYFVHIEEPSQTSNFVLNLTDTPFEKKASFPGTQIPIPSLSAYGAAFVPTQ